MNLLGREGFPPKLETLPQPGKEKHPLIPLIDLPPRQYIDTIARVASLRVREIQDELGAKHVFSGALEDSTFSIPFVCHKTSLPFEKNLVLRISSAYVHEFEDKSLLLVLTEYSKAEPRYSEDITEYVWLPKIGQIRRPIWYIILQGTISNVFGSSGLVKRCNRCRSIVYEKCPNGCEEGWNWDLRVSACLYDGSGAIKMLLGRYLTSKILGRNLSEVFYLANAQNIQSTEGFNVLSFDMKLPETINVLEALVEEPSRYRQHNHCIISAGGSRIYLSKDEKMDNEAVRTSERTLSAANSEDFWIIRRFVEKTLEIRIRQITGRKQIHGIHLLEDPISLYRCEQAKLYLGFSAVVNIKNSGATIEASPQALVRESIWDYIRWRRKRGASAKAIERTLLKHRSNVVLAPYGHLGHIEELMFKKAGNERVSELDSRDFSQFWKETYDFDVAPEETPLLRVKLVKNDVTFTYPPSCVYFDENVIFLTAGTQNYIEMKRAPLKSRVQAIITEALQALKIGEDRLEFLGEGNQRVDAQKLLLYDIQNRLLGRTVKARGSITQFKDQLYFFPQQVMMVT